MIKNTFVLIFVLTLLAFSDLVAANDNPDTDTQYCTAQAQQAGLTNDDDVNDFVADCLRAIKICQEEADDAELGSVNEVQEYITQCLEEFRSSDSPDSKINPDL
jgi:hypothetical protein